MPTELIMFDEGYINDGDAAEEIKEVVWEINKKRFRIEGPLGSGAYGSVVIATVLDAENSDDYESIAIKQISITTADEEKSRTRLLAARTEYLISRYVERQQQKKDFCEVNAVCATRFFYNAKLGIAYIFFPLADPNTLENWKTLKFHPRINGSISRRIHRDEPDLALTWQFLSVSIRLLSAVAALHEMGAAHRDLKPDNVLMSQDQDFDMRLIDFGFACVDYDALQKVGLTDEETNMVIVPTLTCFC